MPHIWNAILDSLPAIKHYYIAAAAFTVLERIFPAERGQPWRCFGWNFAYALSFQLITPIVMVVPSALATSFINAMHPGWVRLDLPHFATGIAALDSILRFVFLPLIPAAVFDFAYYWHHRLQHSVPALWAIHRLHHTMEGLNALGSQRVHWLEEPMRVITMTVPLALIFNITPVDAAWATFVFGQFALFIHSNIRIPFGPFSGILDGPQMHRIHHSVLPVHRGKNYSSIFPLWDILFGTYYAPKPKEWPKTGLTDEPTGTFSYEFFYPFLSWAGGSAWFSARPLVRSKNDAGA